MRWLASATYTQKWLVLGGVIGVIAGLGAVVFFEALRAASYLFMHVIAGYTVPTPAGEGGRPPSPGFVRPWAIPLTACLGALGGALLVFGIAPEAQGHGTDAAIAAVHHNPRGIRLRTVFVKIVASALTIGSGGSGGREGPTGQISAGFGSLLARLFDLSPSDARIAVASGIGAGIGSIFGAPLGGSVLATEIMYRDDFEVEALLPSFIASIVGYAVWGSVEGFGPLFGYVGNYHLTDATHLVWFAIIGVLGGLIGLLYAKGFYGIAALFGRLPLPRWVRPAIGGLIVGCIALAIPEVLGTGYGWIQQSLGRQLLQIPLWIVLILPLARIASTGLSIGSGGSGGIFGPGMVIGAFLGASDVAAAGARRAEPWQRPRTVRHRRDDVLLREHLTSPARGPDHGQRDDRDAVPDRARDGGDRPRYPDRAPDRRHHLPQPTPQPSRVPRTPHPDRPSPARCRSCITGCGSCTLCRDRVRKCRHGREADAGSGGFGGTVG